MARIRSVKPEFFQSDTVSRLPYRARLVFIGLWTHSDDMGRCKDDARLVKAALFPLEDDVTSAMVEDDLNALALAGVIQRYQANGDKLIQVTAWAEHQKINRPTASKYPAPHEGSPIPPRPVTDDSLSTHGGLSEDSRTEMEVEQGREQGRETDEDAQHDSHECDDTESSSSSDFDTVILLMTNHAEDCCPSVPISRRPWRRGVAKNIRSEQGDDIARLLAEGHSPQEVAQTLTNDALGVRAGMRKRGMEVHPPKAWGATA